MLWFMLFLLIVLVMILGMMGVFGALVSPDKPLAPKPTFSRRENQRRTAAYKQAVEEWKQARLGVLAEDQRTHPESTYPHPWPRFYAAVAAVGRVLRGTGDRS